MVEGLLREHVEVYGRQPLAMRPEMSCLTDRNNLLVDDKGKRLRDTVWEARVKRRLRTEGLPAEEVLNIAVDTRRPSGYDKGWWVGRVPGEFTGMLTEQRYGKGGTNKDQRAAFWKNCNDFEEVAKTEAMGGHLYEAGVVVGSGTEVVVLSLGMPCAPVQAWWRYMSHPEVLVETEALKSLDDQGLDIPKMKQPDLTEERFWWKRLGERVREERLVRGLARETEKLTRPSFALRVRDSLKGRVDKSLHQAIAKAEEIYGYVVTTDEVWDKRLLTRKLTQHGDNLAAITIHPAVKPDLSLYSRGQNLWCETLNGIVNSDGGTLSPQGLLVRISTTENANGNKDQPGVIGVAVVKQIASKSGTEYLVSRVLGEQPEREGKYDDPGVTVLPVDRPRHQYMMQRAMGRKDLELIKADLKTACERGKCDETTQNRKTWSRHEDGLTNRTQHIIRMAERMVEDALVTLPEENGCPVRVNLPRVIERVERLDSFGLLALDKVKKELIRKAKAREIFGEIPES